MDVAAAKTRVQIWIAERYRWAPNAPQVVDQWTEEHDFGWVFFFRLPDRPIPVGYEDITGVEHPPVAINREDGAIGVWRRQRADIREEKRTSRKGPDRHASSRAVDFPALPSAWS